ncbi:MAG: DNA polymerase III subunit delta [Bacteroidota bacterium]
MATTTRTYDQLDLAFRNQNFEPLYFLYGSETFLAAELQDVLLAQALAPHERDFNLDIIYGAEAEASQVLAMCASYPVMATRRVVLVREFDRLKGNTLFKAYAERPNPSAVVLLLCSGKPNLSAHPYRALRQHAVSCELKPLPQRKVAGWLSQRIQGLGYRIEPAAVQLLADFVGTDLRTSVTEIDKLITYVGDRSTITVDDVATAGGQTRDANVFELQRALGQGRHDDAHTITERLLQQSSSVRSEALLIVTMLFRYFNKLWLLTACQSQRLPEKEMASRIGVPPFFLNEYLISLRRYHPAALSAAFTALLAADYELKGGAHRPAKLVLTLLLRRLAHVARPAS